MLARNQSLLLRPDTGPSSGLQYVNRCAHLARAWQKLGGTATLVHDELPSRLVQKLSALNIQLQRRNDSDRGAFEDRLESKQAAGSNGRWLVVDGDSLNGHHRNRLKNSNWKLATIDDGSDASLPAKRMADLLIAPAADTTWTAGFEPNETCVLTGDRYRIPLAEKTVHDPIGEASEVPRYARRILVWLSKRGCVQTLVDTLTDVIEVARDRTSIDVVIDSSQRDSPEIVRLKKSNPQVTLRFWQSVDRRLQSMATVQLAIVDDPKNLRMLASRGIPVASVNRADQAFQISESASADGMALPCSDSGRQEFRRSISRLIRDRDQRQSLSASGLGMNDFTAADRIARRLASDRLIFEVADSDDWPDVWRWTCDPESRASALPREDRAAEGVRKRFLQALQQPMAERWMLRLPCGESVGVVALDRQVSAPSAATLVRVLVNPSFRNQGYGTALLERTIELISAAGNHQQIVLQAKPCHQAAHQMARNAGLKLVPPTVVHGEVAHQFGIDLAPASSALMRDSLRKSA